MEHRRSVEQGHYHRLEVQDCPIEVLERLARQVGVGATVENVSPVRERNRWFESRQSIFPGTPEGTFLVRNASFDVAIGNAEFLELLPAFDRQGVFAIFAERGYIPFRASDLAEPARHRALDNLGWWLVFALAGPTTDGWSTIVTPRAELIDLAESLLSGEPASA